MGVTRLFALKSLRTSTNFIDFVSETFWVENDLLPPISYTNVYVFKCYFNLGQNISSQIWKVSQILVLFSSMICDVISFSSLTTILILYKFVFL